VSPCTTAAGGGTVGKQGVIIITYTPAVPITRNSGSIIG
jgi:hypothetical protein